MAKLVFCFNDIGVKLGEDENGLFAIVQTEEERNEVPVEANIPWGPDKTQTLKKLMEANRLEYGLLHGKFLLRVSKQDTRSSPPAEATCSDVQVGYSEEEEELGDMAFRLYMEGGASNYELTCTGMNVTSFKVAPTASALTALRIRGDEITTTYDMQIEENRLMRQKRYEQNLAVIETSCMKDTEEHRIQCQREVDTKSFTHVKTIEERKIQSAQKIDGWQKEIADAELATERQVAINKSALTRMEAKNKQSLSALQLANQSQEGGLRRGLEQRSEEEAIQLNQFTGQLKREWQQKEATMRHNMEATSAESWHTHSEEVESATGAHNSQLLSKNLKVNELKKRSEVDERTHQEEIKEINQSVELHREQQSLHTLQRTEDILRDAELSERTLEIDHEDKMKAEALKHSLTMQEERIAHQQKMDKGGCMNSIF